MKKPRTIVLRHVLTWLVLLLILFATSGYLTRKLFVEDEVDLWLLVLEAGFILITLMVLLSMTLSLLVNRRKQHKGL